MKRERAPMTRTAMGFQIALLVVAGISLAITAAGAHEGVGPYCTRIDHLAGSAPGATLPPGWSLRAVSGVSGPSATVAVVDDSPALVLDADSAAGQIWLELDRPVPRGT